MSAEDLEKRVVFPPTALRQEHTLGTALGQLVLESVAHGGQIAYLRGFHRGMGGISRGEGAPVEMARRRRLVSGGPCRLFETNC